MAFGAELTMYKMEYYGFFKKAGEWYEKNIQNSNLEDDFIRSTVMQLCLLPR